MFMIKNLPELPGGFLGPKFTVVIKSVRNLQHTFLSFVCNIKQNFLGLCFPDFLYKNNLHYLSICTLYIVHSYIIQSQLIYCQFPTTVFAVTNSFRASNESSVPYPEDLVPPNGKRGSELVILLIFTVPDSRFSMKNS